MTNLTGTYEITVNAEISANYYNYGYATITENTDAPVYNDINGRFIFINSTIPATDYRSEWLEGGKVYYLHFGYRKNNSNPVGTDTFTINSVTLNEITTTLQSSTGSTSSPYFTTSGTAGYTTYTRRTVNLNNYSGTYVLIVNAQISSEANHDIGYATMTSTSVTTLPAYNSSSGRFMYISGEVAAQDYVSQELTGGNSYYMYAGYRKDYSTNSGSDKLTINSIKLYKLTRTEVTGVLGEITANGTNYGFDKVDDTYVSNNSDKYHTLANSYIPIDLRGLTGIYKVVLNGEVYNKSNYDKAFATISETTSAPSYNITEGKFMYETGTSALSTATDYTSTTLEGGNIYYLHLGYLNDNSSTSGEDKFVVNSIKVYEAQESKFYFEEVDGKYVSNNQGYSTTTSNSYIPIDLTNTKGKYNLKINAEISSDRNDYGFVIITNTPDTPAYNTYNGRLIYISGEVAAKDYTTILEAGTVYYVHLGYMKNDKTNGGTDTFTINSIELSFNTDDFYHEDNILTDAKGQIVRGLKFGTYEITETNSIEGYTLNSEPVVHVIGNDTDNNITIVNQHQKAIRVHYYLKETGEEYGVEPVKIRDDAEKFGDTGNQYTTAPQITIGEYTLLKDEEGEYIIPKNASGTIGDSDIDIYYYYEDIVYAYTVNYYYDGELEEEETIKKVAKPNTVISEYEPKIRDGYGLEKAENVPLTISEYEDENVIDVYYTREFKVTTDVVEHDEVYFDGTIKESIKGGTISGEDETPYETVAIGNNSAKSILVIPDEGYEIAKITIAKGTEETEIDLQSVLLEDGTIELNSGNGYFKNVQTDIHVEAEFRKKTSVTIKHLDEETKEEVAEADIITGYEGKPFMPIRKMVEYYEASELGITYEDNQATNEENFVMHADETTVICWYSRVKSGIIVRHIEIDENDIKEGLTLSSGTELSNETLTGGVNLEQETTRNTYEGYISVDGPIAEDENIIIVGKDEENKKVTYVEDMTLEIRYYYERQHKISVSEEPITGGKITMESEEQYEMVNRRGSNEKAITVEPEYGYKIKTVTVNGEPIDVTEIEDENHKVVLDKGYFTDVQEDKQIAVEFEQIEASVIVKYVEDSETGELILEETKTGFVNDDYSVEAKEIEGYELNTEKLPENATGKMTEEPITVIYYYIKEKPVEKEFKITTSIKELEEKDSNGNIITSKGGKITGEDEEVVETVIEGNSSKTKIIIEADYGYKIVKITINGEVYDFEDSNTSIEMPLFENMKEDKHIEVEFGRIPAKIIIKYLDDKTEKEIFESETIEGYINDEYNIFARHISGYELNTEKNQDNIKGVITEENITITYYYTKIEEQPEVPEIPDVPKEEKPEIPETPSEQPEIPEENKVDSSSREDESIEETNTTVTDVNTGDNIIYFFIILIIAGFGMCLTFKKTSKNE